jgi:hypothetical protein
VATYRNLPDEESGEPRFADDERAYWLKAMQHLVADLGAHYARLPNQPDLRETWAFHKRTTFILYLPNRHWDPTRAKPSGTAYGFTEQGRPMRNRDLPTTVGRYRGQNHGQNCAGTHIQSGLKYTGRSLSPDSLTLNLLCSLESQKYYSF